MVRPEVLTPWPSAFWASGKHVIGNRAHDFNCFPERPWTVKNPWWASPWCCFSLFQQMCVMCSVILHNITKYILCIWHYDRYWGGRGGGCRTQQVTSRGRADIEPTYIIYPEPLSSLATTPQVSSLSCPSWFCHMSSLPSLPITPQSAAGSLCPNPPMETIPTKDTRNLVIVKPSDGTHSSAYLTSFECSHSFWNSFLSCLVCHYSLMVFQPFWHTILLKMLEGFPITCNYRSKLLGIKDLWWSSLSSSPDLSPYHLPLLPIPNATATHSHVCYPSKHHAASCCILHACFSPRIAFSTPPSDPPGKPGPFFKI